MRIHKLHAARNLQRREAIIEIASVLSAHLPQSVPRRQVQQMLTFMVPFMPLFFGQNEAEIASGGDRSHYTT